MRPQRILAGLALVGGLGAVALGSTFVRRDLAVPAEDLARLPRAPTVEGVALSVLPTARVATQHGFSVRGAALSAPLTSAMVAFVVHHPAGPLLIDAGMGRNGRAHAATVPLLMRAVIDLELARSTADGLASAGIAPGELWGVLLTHSHWDHVSGLEELPEVPVWLTEEERRYAEHDPGAVLFRQIDAAHGLDVRTLRFEDGVYGPFARSWDVFDDGSVVAVPLPGHTPGSVAVVVNLPSGARFLFIGDTAWAKEGVDWPAEKPWLSRRMVDDDPAGVREQLTFLHRLARANPGLVVVPAHDERVHARVPVLPARLD